ncbi:MAG: ferritin-like domain-containing protein [Bryobacteraceae bacterium]|nr:ferritin-like domain-containing protein [Bryobacteraceae bacterium]
MTQLRELIIDEMRDILHAEGQLLNALPKMAQAANHPKLREAFEKHLTQTQMQIERLKEALEMLGGETQPKECPGMMGLIEEGQEAIKEGKEKDPIASDLGLIAAAQKVEHYEISAYGTIRSMARLIGEREVATLMSHTLGEEESADHLLTEIAKPILQEAAMEEFEMAGERS